jgi:hypothetical protein
LYDLQYCTVSGAAYFFSLFFFSVKEVISQLQAFFKNQEYFDLFGTINSLNFQISLKCLIKHAKSQSQVIIIALSKLFKSIIVCKTSSASTFHLIFQFFKINTFLKIKIYHIFSKKS